MWQDLPKTRPENFRLNLTSPLAQGLVFAGLGHSGGPGHSLLMDSSLHGNHGTLTNMDPATDWVWVPELGRWALDFDNDLDFVDLNKVFVFSSINAVSISWWMYPRQAYNSGSNNGRHVWSQLSGSSNPEISFVAWSDNNIYAGFSISGDEDRVILATSASNWQQNTWQHIGLVAVKNQVTRLYHNGIQVGTNAGSTNFQDPTTTFRIARFGTSVAYFDGRISDFLLSFSSFSENAMLRLADRSNVMLEVGGVPLIQHRRTWWPVAVAATGRHGIFRSRIIVGEAA